MTDIDMERSELEGAIRTLQFIREEAKNVEANADKCLDIILALTPRMVTDGGSDSIDALVNELCATSGLADDESSRLLRRIQEKVKS